MHLENSEFYPGTLISLTFVLNLHYRNKSQELNRVSTQTEIYIFLNVELTLIILLCEFWSIINTGFYICRGIQSLEIQLVTPLKMSFYFQFRKKIGLYQWIGKKIKTFVDKYMIFYTWKCGKIATVCLFLFMGNVVFYYYGLALKRLYSGTLKRRGRWYLGNLVCGGLLSNPFLLLA